MSFNVIYLFESSNLMKENMQGGTPGFHLQMALGCNEMMQLAVHYSRQMLVAHDYHCQSALVQLYKGIHISWPSREEPFHLAGFLETDGMRSKLLEKGSIQSHNTTVKVHTQSQKEDDSKCQLRSPATLEHIHTMSRNVKTIFSSVLSSWSMRTTVGTLPNRVQHNKCQSPVPEIHN